jgi:23S rRNA C2498 (ribose-2'-O)-methylase RlmM
MLTNWTVCDLLHRRPRDTSVRDVWVGHGGWPAAVVRCGLPSRRRVQTVVQRLFFRVLRVGTSLPRRFAAYAQTLIEDAEGGIPL